MVFSRSLRASCRCTIALAALGKSWDGARGMGVELLVWGCGFCEMELASQLFQVAGRISEPRRDRATVSVSPPQSRPTVSTTMSGRLPVLSP